MDRCAGRFLADRDELCRPTPRPCIVARPQWHAVGSRQGRGKAKRAPTYPAASAGDAGVITIAPIAAAAAAAAAMEPASRRVHARAGTCPSAGLSAWHRIAPRRGRAVEGVRRAATAGAALSVGEHHTNAICFAHHSSRTCFTHPPP
jgi:hypothetical protein